MNRLLTERDLRDRYLAMLGKGCPDIGIRGLSDIELASLDVTFPLKSEKIVPEEDRD